MNIAITGGNGFIGRHLVEALRHGGHGIRLLSRRPRTDFPEGVTIITGDLTSPMCPLVNLLEGCQVVYHCAGELRDSTAMKPLHVDGTRCLLNAVLAHAAMEGRAMHWVQLSSVGAYGFPPEFAVADRFVTEETPTQPVGPYEVTKTQADEIVLNAQRPGLFTCTIVRPSKVIGPGMPSQSVRQLGAVIRAGKFFYIGRKGAIATYVHVDDVVDLLVLCGADARARGKTFNISNDCLLEEMVESIATAAGVRPPRLRLPEPFVRILVSIASKMTAVPLGQEQISGLVRRTRYSNRKLMEVLGFAPRRSIPGVVGEVAVKA